MSCRSPNPMLDYLSLIQKYIPPTNKLFGLYFIHVTLVTNKALAIGRQLGLSNEQLHFIEEATMLHDIGIVMVNAPEIHCTGELPYICHGVEGRKILEAEGLLQHALICERHTGVGIRKEEIITHNLPLPHRDMVPVSIEEKIICWADLFFSKNPSELWLEKTIEQVRASVAEFGTENIQTFEALAAELKQADRP